MTTVDRESTSRPRRPLVPTRRDVRYRPTTRMVVPGSQSFAASYMELCKKQHSRPLPVICVTLPRSLDFATDRVKMDDWAPILNALSLDSTLESISIRSRYQYRQLIEDVDSERKARAAGKAPAAMTRFLLEWLSHSVAQCVRNSTSLTYLELEGIPLPIDCVAVLCMGLSATSSLRHLSLQRCHIGDDGCQLICRTVADAQSVRSLNLSQCDLTAKSGSALAAALSRQELSLYHDTWKQSLRYREPNLEAMPGLRRLTLNWNPRLGDSAVNEIIDAIRNSLWLKALDLQHCGLTEVIGNEILRMLDDNAVLSVVDVRMNSLEEQTVLRITRKLEANHGPGKSEYSWLNLAEKDRRTSSAGPRSGQPEKEVGKEVVQRPRSAVIARSKRSSQEVQVRRIPPTSGSIKGLKAKPPLPPGLKKDSEGGVLKSDVPRKASLHLDLRSQICPQGPRSSEDLQNEESAVEDLTTTDKVEVGGRAEKGEERAREEGKEETNEKIEQILRQLVEARAKHDKLLEEIKRNDLLLEEERSRREFAEAKLRSTRNNLLELETALKEKERETRGFLLVSQQSLDEICNSFDRLLEMLDSVTRNPNERTKEPEEDSIRAGLRKRVALLIRKTKSENLRRAFYSSDYDVDSAVLESSRKLAKSECNVRSVLPPIAPVHLERNIGDSPDVVSPTLERPSSPDEIKLTSSPGERARAIFSRIINGDSVLDFGFHVG